jgi:hypothetical protein
VALAKDVAKRLGRELLKKPGRYCGRVDKLIHNE